MPYKKKESQILRNIQNTNFTRGGTVETEWRQIRNKWRIVLNNNRNKIDQVFMIFDVITLLIYNFFFVFGKILIYN